MSRHQFAIGQKDNPLLANHRMNFPDHRLAVLIARQNTQILRVRDPAGGDIKAKFARLNLAFSALRGCRRRDGQDQNGGKNQAMMRLRAAHAYKSESEGLNRNVRHLPAFNHTKVDSSWRLTKLRLVDPLTPLF